MWRWWFAGVLFMAVADWLAVGFDRQRWRIVTKPGTLLLLITGFSLSSGWAGDGLWFGLGLMFSLAGDIFLMLREALFPAGLAAFLVAHVFYIIGFNQPVILPDRKFIFPLLGIILISFFVTRRLWDAISRQEQDRWIRFPVLFYTVVISLMLFSSLLTWQRPEWPTASATAVSLGACLFYCSDAILALDRFSAPVKGGQVVVMVTYHLAQLLIVAGVLYRISQG
jgi:uncharacterized membrane protein YhhN